MGLIRGRGFLLVAKLVWAKNQYDTKQNATGKPEGSIEPGKVNFATAKSGKRIVIRSVGRVVVANEILRVRLVFQQLKAKAAGVVHANGSVRMKQYEVACSSAVKSYFDRSIEFFNAAVGEIDPCKREHKMV